MTHSPHPSLHSCPTCTFQALVSVLVVLIIFIYVAVTFDGKLGSLPNNYLDLGYDLSFSNYLGYAAIAVMPISLTSATIFSEAMWQRCWASADKRTLRWGSIYGCFAVIAVVFLFGFGGQLVNVFHLSFIPSPLYCPHSLLIKPFRHSCCLGWCVGPC